MELSVKGSIMLQTYLSADFGSNSADTCKYIEQLVQWLTTAPKITVYRVNTLTCTSEEIHKLIASELQKQAEMRRIPSPPVFVHPLLPEVVLMGSWGYECLKLGKEMKEIIVDVPCGVAVLRGAHVFAPGVKGMGSDVNPGDRVSVYADIDNKCTRGLVGSFTKAKYFVGNGVACTRRSSLFSSNAVVKGVAVEITDSVSGVPCLGSNCVPSVKAMLQNLPSVVCCRALNPQPGDCALDMCAAPGNKTTLLAALMNNEGTIVAIDKTNPKVQQIRDRCKEFSVKCVQAFLYDSTKLTDEAAQKLNTENITKLSGEPPFPPETFDRVLLDAPCSALGQRPRLISAVSVKQLKSYPPLQRKLFQNAVRVLKPGGSLVYSTCTITAAENERIVEWALEQFPCLTLQRVQPSIGGPGLKHVGLTDEQRLCVRRFGPPIADDSMDIPDYDSDTVGFFIACFVKAGS